MKKIILLLLGFTQFSLAETTLTGFVTPTSLTLTVTQLQLSGMYQTPGGTNFLPAPFTQTFNRTDPDFSPVTVQGSLPFPVGRFTSIVVCYSTNRSVVLNANAYQGGGALSNGTPLYSNGTSALTAGSVGTSLTGTAPSTLTNYTIPAGSATETCVTNPFTVPICINDGSVQCSTGDYVLTSPTLSLILDLYDSVGIDATHLSLDNHVAIYPYPVLIPPGAAVHLSSVNAGNVADLSLLFDQSKNLLFSSAYSTPGITGFCSGIGQMTVSGGPATSLVNPVGPTWVQKADYVGSKIQFVAGTCTTSTSCASSGMLTVTDFPQAVGSTESTFCSADTDTSHVLPSELGFSYIAGSGNAGSVNMTVKRVIDQSNLLGVCGSGVCGSYP
jgi:hypothetical protein